MRRFFMAGVAAFVCAVAAEEPAAPSPSKPAAAPMDYAWLAATNLPPPGGLTRAALAHLPKTLVERQEWVRRMRRAAWMPSLEFRYGVGEAYRRPYEYVDRSITVSGTETASERSSESSSARTKGPGGALTDSQSVRDRASRSSVVRSESTERYGPDSYARSEEAGWLNDYGVFLTWDLSRFVFQRDEIAAVAADMEQANFKRAVSDQVIMTYYDLKETLLMLETDALRESVPARVRKERCAYQLDVLTGGVLSSSAGHEPPD